MAWLCAGGVSSILPDVRSGTVSLDQVTYSRSLTLFCLNCLLGDSSLTELSELVAINVAELSQALADLFLSYMNCLLGGWSLTELCNGCLECC